MHSVEDGNPSLHIWLNRYRQENHIPKVQQRSRRSLVTGLQCSITSCPDCVPSRGLRHQSGRDDGKHAAGRHASLCPQDGNWSDVSGENFLRTLLTQPVEQISGSFSEEEPQFAISSPIGGDPRQTAQRIMDIRCGRVLQPACSSCFPLVALMAAAVTTTLLQGEL